MPPLRRYLRISKHHILECHIYTDPPALQQSWLLNPRKPLLHQIFEHIKPNVIPKVLQARENDQWGKKKKPGQKKPDVVVTDEFEVAITLLPTGERHSVLQKHKHFSDRASYKLQSSAKGLIAQSRLAPVDADTEDSRTNNEPTVDIREESDDEQPIPSASMAPRRRRKRPRSVTIGEHIKTNESNDAAPTEVVRDADNASEEEDAENSGDGSPDSDSVSVSASGMFVSSGEEDNHDETNANSDTPNPPKRVRQLGLSTDDDKKMKMEISYEGFAVYGHILCLVIKKPSPTAAKRGSKGKKAKHEPGAMESWLSTQLPAQDYDD
ncbi:hypothetical protein Cpir12675_001472 [Ceratocystis pirilliformis]|uniref:Uncharacterized protein n=1 Tax=Ceratocystis pirilliformis TaxID=259994 RepID=A0ABR3ZFE5_9PEZI